MKYSDQNNRPVEIEEYYANSDEELYIVKAYYLDGEEEDITDDKTLDYLADQYGCFLYQDWLESRADSLYDQWKDRDCE